MLSWEDLPPFMEEVRSMARHLLRQERHAESLQTTALVQTALRRQKRSDQDWRDVTWQNRQYFFGAVHNAMKQALIDHARRRKPKIRAPGHVVRLEDLQLHNLIQAAEETPEQVVALSEVLEELGQAHSELAEVVMYRFYEGLTLDEMARLLELSQSTIKRRWVRARVLLHDAILQRLNES